MSRCRRTVWIGNPIGPWAAEASLHLTCRPSTRTSPGHGDRPGAAHYALTSTTTSPATAARRGGHRRGRRGGPLPGGLAGPDVTKVTTTGSRPRSTPPAATGWFTPAPVTRGASSRLAGRRGPQAADRRTTARLTGRSSTTADRGLPLTARPCSATTARRQGVVLDHGDGCRRSRVVVATGELVGQAPDVDRHPALRALQPMATHWPPSRSAATRCGGTPHLGPMAGIPADTGPDAAFGRQPEMMARFVEWFGPYRSRRTPRCHCRRPELESQGLDVGRNFPPQRLGAIRRSPTSWPTSGSATT